MANYNDTLELEYAAWLQRTTSFLALSAPPERLYIPNIRLNLSEMAEANVYSNFR